jgi:hypothetical protein
MFKFELLTKRDWLFVICATLAMVLVFGSGMYWYVMHYTSVGFPELKLR